jgi:hypothetical protein
VALSVLVGPIVLLPPQLQMEIDSDQPVPEYAGDYNDEAEFADIVAALAAQPTIAPEDFVGEQYIDCMVQMVQTATAGHEEKEAEYRKIATARLCIYLDLDDE